MQKGLDVYEGDYFKKGWLLSTKMNKKAGFFVCIIVWRRLYYSHYTLFTSGKSSAF
ncbi:hypothetical protein MHB50_05155 [Siminovitchia sp. FSL H7-0308]|uniref:hypothetical protein n=1 Tax=Siminovitchia sp. FSL H7-0308 TaxID=2921432 RepID=UPI0030EF60A3